MNQPLKNSLCAMSIFLSSIAMGNCQTFTADPPNPVFRFSTPSALGNSRTNNIVVRFAVMNYSISKAQFQLFPYEIKASDELNIQHPPATITLGRKKYSKKEMISNDVLPGDSVSCQILFPNFKKTCRYIPEMSAKHRVIMGSLFDQEAIINITNLPIYWK